MSRPSFPWPKGTLTFPVWRTRHIRTGDTTPPSRPQGEPNTVKCVPYDEGQPSGHYGGLYDQDTRAVGLGEAPIAPVINRAIYDISGALDMLAEWPDADLDYTVLSGVIPSPPDSEIRLRVLAVDRTFYLGRASTQPFSNPDQNIRCSNFLKIRLNADGLPPVLGLTGKIVEVADVRTKPGPGGDSLYANMPTAFQVYPAGTPGVISVITEVGPGTDDVIEFVGDVAPSGDPGPPTTGFCIFNYSLMERTLIAGAASYDGCFAICHTSLAGPPKQYTVNRDNLVSAKGWLTGDYVYTTHFAWSPTLVLTESFSSVPQDVVLWFGRMRLANMPGPDRSRFMDFLRMMNPTIASYGLVPFVVEEPAGATFQRSFDYANAIFRAEDGQLKGTVAFDFRGEADRDAPAGAETRDSYAGFMHRKLVTFNDVANTILDVDEPVSWTGSTITLTTNFPAHHFWTGTTAHKNLLLGIDLIELTDSTGVKVGLFILSVMGTADVCTILGLDGTAPVLAPDTGTMRVYRPQFRTGMSDSAGLLAAYGGGNLFLGDAYNGKGSPAVMAISLNNDWTNLYNDLYQGFSSVIARDVGSSVMEQPKLRYRVTGDGRVEFSGTSAGYRGRMDATYWNSALWHAGTESLSVQFKPMDDTTSKDWRNRSANFHFLEGSGKDDSTYLQLSTRDSPLGGFGAGDHAGVWMGCPGDSYPIPNIVHDGGGGDHRAAGFLYSLNNSGSMEVALGFTSASDLVRDFILRETPSVRNPPAVQFGGSPARIEMHHYVSIGWSSVKTFYHQVVPAAGQPRTGEAWLFTLNYDGGGFAKERCAWESPVGTAGADDFRLVFPINIPYGAYVTDVSVWYFVTGTGATVSTNLTQCKTDTNKNDTNSSSGLTAIGPGVTVVSAVPEMSIDYNQYFYQVWAGVNPDDSAVVQVFGVRITYEMMDLLPA